MRKRACFLACLALLIVLLESPSQALLRVQNNVPTLTISGTTAYCSVDYFGQSNDSISVTLKLKRGLSTVASWSDSGTRLVSIDESCTVQTGKTYTLVMTATVNGVTQPSVSVTAHS